MKKQHEQILLILIIATLGSIIIFIDPVIDYLSITLYTKLIPYDIVFDPSVDKSQVDASQIINCLHGGGCPAGITYINDETGLKEEREVIPNKQQPIQDFSPESQGITISNNVPTALQQSVFNADKTVYTVYILIILGLATTAFILIKRHWKKK